MAASLVVRCQAETYSGLRRITLLNKEEKELYAPFIQAVVKEVNQQPLIVKKRFIQLMQKTQLLLIPFISTTQVHAEERITFPLLEKAYGLDILPDEVVTIIIQLIIGCGILGVAFAILCFMIAGGYRMIGQADKARMWSVDIIKGLGQILLAPVIILLLVTITSLVFRNIPGLDLFF